MPFTTEIRISPIIEGSWRTLWKVIAPLNFHSERYGKNYVVPAGTVTDLASGLIPSASAAGILHDHLYDRGRYFKQVENRAEADAVFFEAMESSGVPLWRCWVYFLSVRMFGRKFYQP